MNAELNFEAAPFEFQELSSQESGFEFEEECWAPGRSPRAIASFCGKTPRGAGQAVGDRVDPWETEISAVPTEASSARIRASRPGARPEPFRSNPSLIPRRPRWLLQNTCAGCRAP